jgi:hypothetical protein
MWNFLTGSKMQRLVVIATIFAILTTVDLHWDDSRWWCIAVLLLIIEWLAYTAGVASGAEHLLDLHRINLLQLKDLYDRNESGENVTLADLNKVLKKKDKNDTE